MNFDDETINKIINYNKQHYSNRMIAKELNIPHYTINKIIKKLGLKSKFSRKELLLLNLNDAQCSRCQQLYPLSNFQFGRKGQQYEYRFSYCNKCRKLQSYYNLSSAPEKFIKNRFNIIKRRAIRNNIPFNLTYEQCLEQYYYQKGRCFYTDIDLSWKVGNGLVYNNASFDKIIPQKGYIYGNVVFCSRKINAVKNDLPLSEIKKWMPKWYNRIQKHFKRIGFDVAQSEEF